MQLTYELSARKLPNKWSVVDVKFRNVNFQESDYFMSGHIDGFAMKLSITEDSISVDVNKNGYTDIRLSESNSLTIFYNKKDLKRLGIKSLLDIDPNTVTFRHDDKNPADIQIGLKNDGDKLVDLFNFRYDDERIEIECADDDELILDISYLSIDQNASLDINGPGYFMSISNIGIDPESYVGDPQGRNHRLIEAEVHYDGVDQPIKMQMEVIANHGEMLDSYDDNLEYFDKISDDFAYIATATQDVKLFLSEFNSAKDALSMEYMFSGAVIVNSVEIPDELKGADNWVEPFNQLIAYIESTEANVSFSSTLSSYIKLEDVDLTKVGYIKIGNDDSIILMKPINGSVLVNVNGKCGFSEPYYIDESVMTNHMTNELSKPTRKMKH